MIGPKVERIERLLRALDMADGNEDFIIHREHARSYIRDLLAKMPDGAPLDDFELTREELEMSLKSLDTGPPSFKRKSNYEILESLLAARLTAKQQAEAKAASNEPPAE